MTMNPPRPRAVVFQHVVDKLIRVRGVGVRGVVCHEVVGYEEVGCNYVPEHLLRYVLDAHVLDEVPARSVDDAVELGVAVVRELVDEGDAVGNVSDYVFFSGVRFRAAYEADLPAYQQPDRGVG
jgi:hypothetical protein